MKPKDTMQKIIAAAVKKGLQVRRNQFQPGWNVTLPSGSNYHAKTDSDLIQFVTGF